VLACDARFGSEAEVAVIRLVELIVQPDAQHGLGEEDRILICWSGNRYRLCPSASVVELRSRAGDLAWPLSGATLSFCGLSVAILVMQKLSSA
jgi:hypothetical protein